MKIQSSRGRAAALVATSAMIAPALAILLAAAPASAQQASSGSSSSSKGSQVQEVVVTGTLFRSRIESAAPLTVLSAQHIASAGITTVTDAVRTLSADNSGTLPNAFAGAFAFGASGVALRGLTVNSTLVLTDGLRNADYPIGDDGIRDFVDLNTLPLVAVDRIDVFKDGASALYGADAIGGVVNIILKPSYQGEEITAEGGTTQHGGDTNYHFDGLVGYGDLDTQHFNVYIGAEYEHDDPIKDLQRPFPFNTSDLTPIGGSNPGNGVPETNIGSIYGAVAPAIEGTPGDILSGVQTGPWQVERAGGCGPLGKLTADSGSFGGSYCAQNIDGYNLYDSPLINKGGLYARATVQINPDTRAYVAFSYYENSTYNNEPYTAIQAQAGVPQNTNTIVLPWELPGGSLNPNNPFAALHEYALINYAFGDIPAYQTTDDHVFHGVANIRGDLAGWTYELGLVAEHENLNYTQAGYIYYPQLITDITEGTYNFVDPSKNSAAVRNALGGPVSKLSTSDLDEASFHATHDVFDLPGGPMKVGFGVQAYYEAQNNPELNPNGLYENLGVDHAAGNRYVISAFGEGDLPLLKNLDLDASGRFDHYSDFGNALSPKVELKYMPFRQLTLRATYSNGFRAPSFAEAHTGAVGGFVTLPLQTLAPDYYAAHGGDGYVQPYSVELVNIANPNIKPETSKSFTVGAVVQPVSWISATADYYYIEKDNLIAPSSVGAALGAYFAGTPLPAGDTVTADVPDPQTTGQGGLAGLARPLVVGTAYINGNSLITTGVDVDFRVRFDLPWELKVSSDVQWTDIFEWRYSQPGSPTYDTVGTESPYNLSSGAGTPKYRANWTTNLTWRQWTLTGTMYYTSSMYMNALDLFGPGCLSPSNTSSTGFLPANCRVASFIDYDMNLDYKVTDKIDLFFTVYNVADAKPPIDPPNYAGVNYNPTYDEAGIIGRAFKIGVHAHF